MLVGEFREDKIYYTSCKRMVAFTKKKKKGSVPQRRDKYVISLHHQCETAHALPDGRA